MMQVSAAKGRRLAFSLIAFNPPCELFQFHLTSMLELRTLEMNIISCAGSFGMSFISAPPASSNLLKSMLRRSGAWA